MFITGIIMGNIHKDEESLRVGRNEDDGGTGLRDFEHAKPMNPLERPDLINAEVRLLDILPRSSPDRPGNHEKCRLGQIFYPKRVGQWG